MCTDCNTFYLAVVDQNTVEWPIWFRHLGGLWALSCVCWHSRRCMDSHRPMSPICASRLRHTLALSHSHHLESAPGGCIALKTFLFRLSADWSPVMRYMPTVPPVFLWQRVRCHVCTTASETEALELPVCEFGIICLVACEHLTPVTSILKRYWKHIYLTRPRCLVTFIYRHCRNILTYLLTYLPL